jgi:hypothetical protein
MTAINFPKYSSGGAWRLFRGVLIGRHSRTGEQKQELQDWSSRILRGLQADGPVRPAYIGPQVPQSIEAGHHKVHA